LTGSGYTWFAVLAPYTQLIELEDVNSFFGNLRNGDKYEGIWGCLTDGNRPWIGSRSGKTFGRWDVNNPMVLAEDSLETDRYYLIMGRMGAGTGEVTVELFINDAAAPVASSPYPVFSESNASKMVIGQERDAVNHPGRESFSGEISRFLLYDRPLSAEEMKIMVNKLMLDPIYQKHPNANLKVICDASKEKLDEVGDLFKVDNRTDNYDEVLKDPDIDAIHLVTPIGEHAPMTIQALKAGKHVGSTVPMATTVDECRQIVELVEETGLKYMMMETAVYTREFLYMKELYDKGELGDIQFIMASHPQDMDGWPDYWPGLPPMWYATHCMAPALGIMRSKAESVSCIGSGKIRDDLIAIHNSPFAIESAHVKFLNSNVYAHVHRNLFDTARQYKESLDVYGSKKSVE